MKRLRTHGLIKKIGRTYKYYLTGLGKQVIALGLKLKNLYRHSRTLSGNRPLKSLARFGKDLMIKVLILSTREINLSRSGVTCRPFCGYSLPRSRPI
jgi:hypothetical protein